MSKDTQAFIVRIWFETTDEDGNGSVWRGSIDHVGDNRRLYFTDLNGIIRFIEEQVGLAELRSDPWWRSLAKRLHHERKREDKQLGSGQTVRR